MNPTNIPTAGPDDISWTSDWRAKLNPGDVIFEAGDGFSSGGVPSNLVTRDGSWVVNDDWFYDHIEDRDLCTTLHTEGVTHISMSGEEFSGLEPIPENFAILSVPGYPNRILTPIDYFLQFE